MSQPILTPVGRIVQGHPMHENTKDQQGKPMTDSKGNPRSEFFFSLAIPVNDPGLAAFWEHIQAVGASEFPGGQWQKPDFAWKLSVGDNYPDKEGFPGHWVFKLSSGFQPKVYTAGGKSQIVDPTQIKRGDYVRAQVVVNGNKSPNLNPGIFINPTLIELVGYGEEISSAPDGAQVFGNAPAAALPAGASSTPVASAVPVAATVAPVAAAAPPVSAPVAPVATPAAPSHVAPGQPVAPAQPDPTQVQPAPNFLIPGAPATAPAAPAIPGIPTLPTGTP